jgi:ABC-type transport system involved in multi-copper enzyme maturation permease subunit
MFGSTILMEFKTGWKGFFIFTLIVILVAGGIPSIYPTFRDSMLNEYEGSDKLTLELPEEGSGNDINLSWEPVQNVISYVIIESNSSHLGADPIRVFYTNATNISLPYDFDETRYYVVSAVINFTTLDSVFLGMTATDVGADNPFQDIIENPAYSSFSGGRDVDFMEIRGFLTFELFGWWWMLVGFFLAYMAVAMVANDFSEKRMDLIFSTPLSRELYLLEKFLALAWFTLFVLVVAALALAGGVDAVGYGNELDLGIAFQAFIGCLPFLLVIAAVGFLTAVVFRSTRVGMGLTFMFILFEFIFYTISGFSKDLEWFKYLSIMEYWDYRGVLLDSSFNLGYFFGLFVAAFVILGLAIYIFKKRDIPA